MRALARLRSLYRNLVHRGRVERDLDDEIAAVFSALEEEHRRSGLSADDARRAAAIELGRAASIKTQVRDARTGAAIETLWQDVRFGLRLLRRTPSFTAAAVLSVTLGVGATIALFGLLDAVRLRPLPVPRAAELAEVRLDGPRCCRHTGRNRQVSLPLWREIERQQQAFSAMFAFADTRFNLAPQGDVRYVEGLYVSGGFFQVLGVSALMGRTIEPADDRPGCNGAPAVISHALWQREFGGRRDILGQTLTLRGGLYPVAGVMPPDFFGVEVGRRFDVALPICAAGFDRRDHWWLAAMGRLKPGWTAAAADAHLAALGPSLLNAAVPPNYSVEMARTFPTLRFSVHAAPNGVSPLREEYGGALWLLFGIAAVVLLTACANVGSLSLVRAAARQPELALRSALGATRLRIVRQLAVEGALVTLAGAAAGLALARAAGGGILRALSTPSDPIVLDLRPDWRVAALTAGIVGATTMAFAMLPVLRARTSQPSIGARVTAGRRTMVVREVLVALQVATSVILVAAALLFVSTFRNLATMNTGLAWDRVLVANVFFADGPPPAARAATQREVARRIAAVPGIEHVAHASTPPFSGSTWSTIIAMPSPAGEIEAEIVRNQVSAGYFAAVDTPLVAGRDFDHRDTPASPLVAVVNEQFARTFFGGQSPIGRRYTEGKQQFDIIGLVRDSKQYTLREEFRPITYSASAQSADAPSTVRFVLRRRTADAATTAGVRDAILGVAPGAGIRFATGGDMLTDAMRRERLLAGLAGFFGVVALALAIVGVYGVVAYAASTRRREIGIRRALGARAADVLRAVLGRIGFVASLGLAVGLALTLSLSAGAASLLYGVQPHDPRLLAAVAGTMLLAGLAASAFPARRALRTDPVSVLKDE